MRKFLIKVNGVQYEVECQEIYEDVSSVNTIPQAEVSKVTAEKTVPVQSAAPATEQATAKPVQNANVGSVRINSPMPGTIVDVFVKEGDSVKEGDVVLILEAMKMENEIYAPKSGIIATVNVSKGSSVNAGDLLLSLN